MENESAGNPISQRKIEHLRIVLEKDVLSSQDSLLGDIHLLHQALPELNIEEIDLSCRFFDKPLKAPFMIASMTGGADTARKLNRGLAEVAANQGIAFGVGSQRIMLRHPEMTEDFAVRKWIGDGVLLGNIGAVQLEEYSPNVISDMVKAIEADGLCIHLNIGQEMMQQEGHRHFKGLTDNIRRLVDKLEGRVLVKETGAGLSPQALYKLADCGVKYIDVAGAGGTSWTKVEMYRAPETILRQTAATFADWGIPTGFSLVAASRILGNSACIMASGGIRNGLDIARSIAVGADMAAFARPALLAFMEKGSEGAITLIETMKNELKTAMLLTGAQKLSNLRQIPRVYTGELRQWLADYGWLTGDKK
jgi:isopentenyl-diphosphate delta-isomerase